MTKEKNIPTQTQDKNKNKKLDFNTNTKYTIEDAINICKQSSKAKFDESVEVHFRLGIDPRKGDQQIRSTVALPHGTGKIVKIAAFVTPEKEKEAKDAGADIVGGEDLIEKIKKTEKTDFDIAIAEPVIMRNLAKIAKILGTRGLMPSPKNETITTNPKKTIQELKKGKVSFKNDKNGNIHVSIGKISFDEKKLLENYTALFTTIKKVKPNGAKGVYLKNISICSTMGHGIKILEK